MWHVAYMSTSQWDGIDPFSLASEIARICVRAGISRIVAATPAAREDQMTHVEWDRLAAAFQATARDKQPRSRTQAPHARHLSCRSTFLPDEFTRL